MKKIILAMVLSAISASAFAGYNYNYKLDCGKKYPHVDVLDSDVLNIAIIGKGEKEMLAEHFTGIYHAVGGVSEQNGMQINVYAHAIDPKKFKGEKTADMPVSAWDEFTLVYTGDGVNRQYNLIADENTTCKTISYTDNSKPDKK